MPTPFITNVNSNFFYDRSWIEARQLTEDDIDWTNWVFSKEVMPDERNPWSFIHAFCHMVVKPEVSNFSSFPADAVKRFEEFCYRSSERKITSCEINEQISLVGIRKEKQYLKVNETIAQIKEQVKLNGDQLRSQALDQVNKKIALYLEKERENYINEFVRCMSSFESYDMAEVDRIAGNENLNVDIAMMREQLSFKVVELNKNRNNAIINSWKKEDDRKYPQVAVDRLLERLSTPGGFVRVDFSKIVSVHN